MKRHIRPQSSHLLPSGSGGTVMVRNPELISKIVENYQDLRSVVPYDVDNKRPK